MTSKTPLFAGFITHSVFPHHWPLWHQRQRVYSSLPCWWVMRQRLVKQEVSWTVLSMSCFFSLLCLTIFKGPTLLASAVTIHTGVDRVRPTHSQNYQTRDLNVWSAANVRVSIVCLCCLFIYIYIYISRNLKSDLSSGFDELFIRWTLLVPGTE